MRLRLARVCAALAALALLAAAPASAQVPGPFARDLAQQLARSDQFQIDAGFSRAAGPFAGGLAQNQVRRFPLMMRAGQPYRVVGVCDARCTDLDFRLYAPDGALITQDVRANASAAVQINPPATGNYQVEAVMAACGAAPCYFAFNVYSR